MKKILIIVALATLTACATNNEPPTDFELGREILPPKQCQEFKERGGEC